MILVVPKWILLFGYGLTLYKLIIVRRDGDIPYLVAHETEHTRQWVEAGKFKFPFLYLKENFDNSYDGNMYELMAISEGIANKHKYDKKGNEVKL